MTAPAAGSSRQPHVERWLDERSIPWEYVEDFPLAAINIAKSLQNQARTEPLNAATVEQYALDMEKGDVFPALIVNRAGGVLIGGNHRNGGAVKAGRKTHPAYHVGPLNNPNLVRLLAIEDNRTHGLALTKEERLGHAVQLVDGGVDINEVAATCQLRPQRIRVQMMARRATIRAIKLDINGVDWVGLSATTKSFLHGIEDDKVFAAASHLVMSKSVASQEVSDFVARIKERTNRTEALAFIKEIEQFNAGRVRRKPGRPASSYVSPSKRLVSDLDRVIAFHADDVVADIGSEAEAAEVRRQIQAAARRLMEIDNSVKAGFLGAKAA